MDFRLRGNDGFWIEFVIFQEALLNVEVKKAIREVEMGQKNKDLAGIVLNRKGTILLLGHNLIAPESKLDRLLDGNNQLISFFVVGMGTDKQNWNKIS